MNRDFEDERHDRRMTAFILIFMITVVLFLATVDCFATDPDVRNVIDSVKVSVELVKDSVTGKVSHQKELEPGIYSLSGKNRQLVMVVAQPICLECLNGLVYVAPMKDLLPEDLRKAMELIEPEKKEHNHD